MTHNLTYFFHSNRIRNENFPFSQFSCRFPFLPVKLYSFTLFSCQALRQTKHHRYNLLDSTSFVYHLFSYTNIYLCLPRNSDVYLVLRCNAVKQLKEIFLRWLVVVSHKRKRWCLICMFFRELHCKLLYY